MNILIPNRTFFRIGEVAKILGVKPYVIRFWEGEFPFLAPTKASSGQRVYRRSQIESLVLVKHLLHVERYSIEGAKKKLTELRKSSQLRIAMNEVVENGRVPETDVGEKTVIGVTVSKPESLLHDQINDLRKLIRDPKMAGIEVPGLKKI